MERNEVIIKPIKIALITGIAAFVGFCLPFLLMPLNMLFDWKNALYLLPSFLIIIGYFLLFGTAVIGLIIASAIGFITYLIFRFQIIRIYTEKQLKITKIILCSVSLVIGFFLFQPTDQLIRETKSGKEHIGTVDTNNDGKSDKWVHDDIYGSVTEVDYDTNLDGRPDVWEYYKNSQVYKKEIDTDFDGKSDKTENYK